MGGHCSTTGLRVSTGLSPSRTTAVPADNRSHAGESDRDCGSSSGQPEWGCRQRPIVPAAVAVAVTETVTQSRSQQNLNRNSKLEGALLKFHNEDVEVSRH